jgi:hypothetical protein
MVPCYDRQTPEVFHLCRLFDEFDVQGVISVRVSEGLEYLCCLFAEFDVQGVVVVNSFAELDMQGVIVVRSLCRQLNA